MELASLIVPSNSVSILPMLPLYLFGNSYRHFMISSRSMRVEILESGRNRMADVCTSVFLCWREFFFFFFLVELGFKIGRKASKD